MFPRLALALLLLTLAVAPVAAQGERSASEMDVLAAMVLDELESPPPVTETPGVSSDFVFDEPSAPAAPAEPAAAAEPAAVVASSLAVPSLELGPRHVWFAGTSGPLRYGRGVLLRPAEGVLEPVLELRLQVAHRLASGEPSPVGFRVATNYLTWLASYELEVQQASDGGWAPVFSRQGDIDDLLPVLALRRPEVARMFCAAPQMRARLVVRDAAGRQDRTGWLEFKVRPPSHTYEGLALLSSPAARATREAAGIPLRGARPAELWSLDRRPRGAWTRGHLEGTLLAELLLPLESVPPLQWSRGHLGDPARLDPVWYWEGDQAAALLARPAGMPALPAPPEPEELARPAPAPAPRSEPRVRRLPERPAAPAPDGSKDPEAALAPWVALGG